MTDAREQPIGVFDSGFGGLTVVRSLIDLMPNESLVYIGDNGRYPYGNKPASEVRGYAVELAESLVRDHGAKMIVVACILFFRFFALYQTSSLLSSAMNLWHQFIFFFYY